MGDLKYPEDKREWAKSKGLLRTCPVHHRDFDPHVGCSECRKENSSRKNRRKEEREKRKGELFKDVVWPASIGLDSENESINGDLDQSKIKRDTHAENEDYEGLIWCSNCERHVKTIDIRDKLNHSVRYVCIPCGKTLREIKVTGEQDQTNKPNLPVKENEEEQDQKRAVSTVNDDFKKSKIKRDVKKGKSFEEIWRYAPNKQSIKHTEKSTLWGYITRGFKKANR